VAGDAAARPHRATLAERREARATIEDPAEVLNAAARYLEARPRSTSEVRRRLTSMGFRAPLVDQAVRRMTELGYLDDEAFARTWVASRDRARPRGAHALRRELQLKGVDRQVIDGVLGEREADRADAPDGADEGDAAGEASTADEAAAERLLGKKLSTLLRDPDARKRLQKAYGLLARNGFAPDVCSSVSRRVLATSTTDEASA
jgi:regulatory protein